MHFINQKMWCFTPRMYLSLVTVQLIFIWESYATKPRHFAAEIGISSLSVESNNFGTAWPISGICSSNDAASRKKFGSEGKFLKFAFSGVTNKHTPSKGVSSQNAPFCDFWTTQPIQTNSNSIDAARQAEYDTKLQNVKILNLGEQFSWKFPKVNFPAKNRNMVITFERMKVHEQCQQIIYSKPGPRSPTVTSFPV
jgi:hypothetical protein